MAFEPKKITSEHILAAARFIETENIELISSTRWLVEIEGKTYPPKEIMRYAHFFMNGERVWNRGGGPPTNKYLEEFGFKISDMRTDNDPVLELINRYKTEISANGLNDERYKWELLKTFGGRPDTDATDFSSELRSVDYRNLIYPVGLGVVHHLARERTEPYRECFKLLFDEEKPLVERIEYFNTRTLEIYREIVPERRFSHHQDERTMATFLTYHDPTRYTFYKDSFYQKYCKLVGIKAKKKGEKYVHYLGLVLDFIDNYIVEDAELLKKVNELLGSDCFDDKGHLLLAQDILYRTLDKLVGVDREYWRIGTKDNEQSHWPYMLENEKASIGWSALGDLDDADIKNKKSIDKLLLEVGHFTDDNRQRSRKAGEIFNFYTNLNVGDVVLAQDGHEVIGIGIVNDEYHYDGAHPFAHQKDVEWKVINPDLSNAKGNLTTFYPLTDITLINQVDELLNNPLTDTINIRTSTMNGKQHLPLNQILFGPPGTGKTFSTVFKALEIIEKKTEAALRLEEYEILKTRFDGYLESGQIVFTTFHQSMSYEDFIEGIKPLPPSKEGGNVNYEVVDGIFKQMCLTAARRSKPNFSWSFNKFIKSIVDSGEEYLEVNTPTGIPFWVSVNRNNNLTIYTTKKKNPQGSLTKENLERFAGGDPTFIGWEGYARGIINHLENDFELSRNTDDNTDKNFVLIIDEINRGNVSQVFGELITLIESNKRSGSKEALTVKLPYSKELFNVPPNLYLIGTMNTADRSVEALDTALRRRFIFTEMPPKPGLISEHGKTPSVMVDGQNFNLQNLLTTINNRLEVLLDKDHLIGHSFFMKVEDVLTLKMAFSKEIIPLLQEYFYGDFGKISLVLGEGFCIGEEADKTPELFAKVTTDYDSSLLLDKLVYKINDPIEMEENQLKKALSQLMGTVSES